MDCHPDSCPLVGWDKAINLLIWALPSYQETGFLPGPTADWKDRGRLQCPPSFPRTLLSAYRMSRVQSCSVGTLVGRGQEEPPSQLSRRPPESCACCYPACSPRAYPYYIHPVAVHFLEHLIFRLLTLFINPLSSIINPLSAINHSHTQCLPDGMSTGTEPLSPFL